jgi:putrescine transport system permease protein
MEPGRLRAAAGLMRRWLLLGPVWAWLLLFIALPAMIVLALSFSQSAASVPPYDPLVTWSGWWPSLQLHTDNYGTLVSDDFYLAAALQSLLVASVSSLLCVLIGYPMALGIARSPERFRSLLLLLVMLPFWTGFLLRIVAWIGLLRDEGWINTALLAVGVIHEPIRMLYTPFAMYVGIVYCYLPFMVLPLYARLSKLDPALEEAACDLGASPLLVFLKITLPLSLPGVGAGLALVFMPAIGEYVIPELLGGPSSQTVGRALWNEFFSNHDWPMAAAVANALLLGLMLPIALFRAAQRRI